MIVSDAAVSSPSEHLSRQITINYRWEILFK